MSNLINVIKSVAADTRITREELEQLLEAGTTPGGQATAELKALLPKFVDALEPEAAEDLRLREGTLGATFIKPPDLANDASLAGVRAGSKNLSAAANSNDPAVSLVQRALMRIAVRENNPAFGLPKFGADGNFGAETTDAVKAFQRSARVTEDGIVGKNTIKQLILALQGRASELNSLRFKDSPELKAVMDGTVAALGNGASGEAVKIVQRVLLDLGYPLPKFGADGSLGKETMAMIKRFQHDTGLTESGRVDTATLVKLDAVAPAPGTQAILRPEYQRMLRDGALPITIGVGFDEDSSHVWAAATIKDGLASRGFAALNVAAMSDADLANKGINPGLIDRSATYYFKSAVFQGQTRPILIKYIDPTSSSPKAQYEAGLVKNGLSMYAGHARYGSGPDFDAITSTAQNYVIGVNSTGHKNGTLTPAYDAHIREILKDAPNDLERTEFSNDYQMWVFFGCTTLNYDDELRVLPRHKSSDNLDAVMSNDVLSWGDMPANILTMLDGVLSEQTTNQIGDSLFAVNKVAFTFDGFGGNKA